MATSEQYFSLVRTSKSSWIAVPVDQSEKPSDAAASEAAALRNSAPHLFAQASGERAGFTERFPRLTITMIALLLFSVSIAAEVEMLRNAGYFWR